MPTFTRSVAQLSPDTSDPNNSNSQSSWFSYVRTVYSPQRGGTIKPPTKTEFMREWNSCWRSGFTFTSRGETLEEHKTSLLGTHFPPFYMSHIRSEDDRWKKLKVVTWTRMVMAFNMYADARKLLNMRPSCRVDFIGSMADRHNVSRWEDCFHGRCVLYIRDEEIVQMSEMLRDGRTSDFWRCIFRIYDCQFTNINIRINRSHEIPRGTSPVDQSETHEVSRFIPAVQSQTPAPSVPRVDNPTHSIAQEYLNRTDDEEEDIALDNQQIANMIMNTRDPLPDEIKKIIHETCVALHMSCSLVPE